MIQPWNSLFSKVVTRTSSTTVRLKRLSRGGRFRKLLETYMLSVFELRLADKRKKKKRRRGNLGFQWRLSSMHMPLNAYTRIHRYILYDRNLRYHRHHRFLTSVIYTLLWRRQRPDIFIRKGVPSIITAPTPHFYAFMHFVIQRAMPALFIREFRKYIFALKLLPRLLINKRKNGKGLKDSFNKLFIGLSS